MQNKMQKRGFTLIELVIVLVILAILVSLALPTFMGARRRAYRAEAYQILNEIKTLAWGYNLENGGIPGPSGPTASVAWPSTLSDLGFNTTAGEPGTANWVFSISFQTSNIGGLDCAPDDCLNMTASGNSTYTTGQTLSLYLASTGGSAILP